MPMTDLVMALVALAAICLCLYLAKACRRLAALRRVRQQTAPADAGPDEAVWPFSAPHRKSDA